MSSRITPTGVIRYQPEKSWAGLTVIPALIGMSYAKGAVLIDMNGNIVNTWEGLYGVFDNKMLPNGRILGCTRFSPGYWLDGMNLTQMDWDGRTEWSFDRGEELKNPPNRANLLVGQGPSRLPAGRKPLRIFLPGTGAPHKRQDPHKFSHHKEDRGSVSPSHNRHQADRDRPGGPDCLELGTHGSLGRVRCGGNSKGRVSPLLQQVRRIRLCQGHILQQRKPPGTQPLV